MITHNIMQWRLLQAIICYKWLGWKSTETSQDYHDKKSWNAGGGLTKLTQQGFHLLAWGFWELLHPYAKQTW